ncbi:MAG: acyl-CoA dehydrogenase family protein [Halobacteriaceae archaeon]
MPELLSEDPVPEYAREAKREARAFADEHVRPAAAEYFAAGEYPWEVLEAGREAGLVAADVDEAYGGRGFDVVQMLAVAEELYRADAGIALTLQLASFGAEIVERYGSEDLRERLLPPLAAGEALTGLAVSEPQTGSDLAGMETRAEADGDEYVIDGEKYWIGNGVEADWVTLYARTGDDEDDRYGNHTLFVVPTDADGYEAEHIPEKMAMRASKQAHVTLDSVRVPAANRISHEGTGFMILAEFFNVGRAVVAGHGLGLAAAAIEETTAFVSDREAFGRTVDRFQAVQHGVADMLIGFESARALAWTAARNVRDGENPGYWAALAKTKATETAVDCAERGMQYHGGRSVLADRRIARVYRDARIPVVYEGANEIQRNLIFRQF